MDRDGKAPEDHPQPEAKNEGQSEHGSPLRNYARFGAMILTSTVVMYVLTYANTYALQHARFSETRVYMALLMGAAMAIIMLSFMWSMHRSFAANVSIVAAAVILGVAAVALVRTQVLVQDRSYMRAMIPHHSIAILTSENAEIGDRRVCELAVRIIEAQRREIAEMEWLIEDIALNGLASTEQEAIRRPVPDMSGTSIRACS